MGRHRQSDPQSCSGRKRTVCPPPTGNTASEWQRTLPLWLYSELLKSTREPFCAGKACSCIFTPSALQGNQNQTKPNQTKTKHQACLVTAPSHLPNWRKFQTFHLHSEFTWIIGTCLGVQWKHFISIFFKNSHLFSGSFDLIFPVGGLFIVFPGY